MARIRHLVRARHAAFAALLACALLVRLVVPAGWMPVADAGGGVTVSICTGMGAAEMVLAADGTIHPEAPAQDHGGDHPCAFAGAVASLATATIAAAAPPPVATAAAAAPRPAVTIGRGLAAPPPPARGPPTLI